MGPAVDVGTVVDIVGPLCNWGVAHGAVTCLRFAPAVVSAPRCVDGVCLDEVEESHLGRVEVLFEGVGGLLISACGESSVVFLSVEFAPECVTHLPDHDAEEVGGGVHVVGGTRDGPVERPNGDDVIGS